MHGGLPFHVLGSSAPMPDGERIVYVDGSAPGSTFRPGIDLELSHWVPTSTSPRWAADTSTEICLRFLADPPDDADDCDLVVNDHVDVDGVLSVFCLAHPDVAVAHREAIVGAAEMGDLSAGVGWESFRLAQELTLLMGGFRAPGRDPLATYAEAFARIPEILADDHPAPRAVQRGWQILEAQAAMVEAGDLVDVIEVGPRLVAYVQRHVGGRWDDQVRIAPFNALIDDTVWLWPHVRNRRHAETLQLVSTEAATGWAHDLWLPGYVWPTPPTAGDPRSSTPPATPTSGASAPRRWPPPRPRSRWPRPTRGAGCSPRRSRPSRRSRAAASPSSCRSSTIGGALGSARSHPTRSSPTSARRSPAADATPAYGRAVATEDDVRRIALALPETVEKPWFHTPGFRVKDKGFLRIRSEAEGGLVVFVADLDEKDALLASDERKFFTTPHYDGYPTVLVHLDAVGVDELAELITDSWLIKAPARVRKAFLDAHPELGDRT